MSNEPKCVAGCKAFTGGEIRHHKDCPFYPESLSKILDDIKTKNKKLMNKKLDICVDFDGTCVTHEFPDSAVGLVYVKNEALIRAIQ